MCTRREHLADFVAVIAGNDIFKEETLKKSFDYGLQPGLQPIQCLKCFDESGFHHGRNETMGI